MSKFCPRDRTQFLVILCVSLCSIKATHVLIDKFKGTCPGYKQNSTLIIGENKFHLINHTTYISHKVTALRDFQSNLKIEILPTRCKSKDALDTCETYRSYKLRNACTFLVSENAPWSPFVKNYKPPVQCPLKKGTYTLTNGTLDPTALPQWTKSYWKVVTVIREQDSGAFVLCTYIEFQIV